MPIFHHYRRPSSPAGLATLELVLVLPILLLVMGLMVDLGTVASWKVRAVVVARDQVWKTRHGRHNGAGDPRPANWPQPYTMSTAGGGTVSQLDDQAFHQPVVHGPLGNINVNTNLLDSTRGLVLGKSHLDRQLPLLGRLGQYHFDLSLPLLDDRWQYWDMGLGGNRSRRIPLIYPTLLDDPNPSLEQAFQQAVSNIRASPLQPALAVLDRDSEVQMLLGSQPDFHPRLAGFCSLDSDSVQQNQFKQLVQQIEGPPQTGPKGGLPGRMTQFWISMYQRVVGQLQQQVPAPQSQIAQYQSLIQQLQNDLSAM